MAYHHNISKYIQSILLRAVWVLVVASVMDVLMNSFAISRDLLCERDDQPIVTFRSDFWVILLVGCWVRRKSIIKKLISILKWCKFMCAYSTNSFKHFKQKIFRSILQKFCVVLMKINHSLTSTYTYTLVTLISGKWSCQSYFHFSDKILSLWSSIKFLFCFDFKETFKFFRALVFLLDYFFFS